MGAGFLLWVALLGVPVPQVKQAAWSCGSDCPRRGMAFDFNRAVRTDYAYGKCTGITRMPVECGQRNGQFENAIKGETYAFRGPALFGVLLGWIHDFAGVVWFAEFPENERQPMWAQEVQRQARTRWDFDGWSEIDAQAECCHVEAEVDVFYKLLALVQGLLNKTASLKVLGFGVKMKRAISLAACVRVR